MKSSRSYTNPLKQETWLHLLLWATVLLFPYVKFIERAGGYPESFLHELNALAFILIPSYAFYSWWLPMSIVSRWRWLIVLVLVFLASIFGYEYTDSLFHQGNHTPFLWKQLFSAGVKYTAFIAFFFALYLMKNSLRQKQQLAEIAQEKETAELAALKAQVTPHFLFNTLNGLYVDALKTDKALAASILSLSDNTRYFLKEGQQEKVSLEQELNHIDNYMALQQKRLSKKVKLRFTREVENQDMKLAPLLLIPIIENAFKYSSMLRGDAHEIAIVLQADQNNLHLSCTNPYEVQTAEAPENEWMKSGIGLSNIKQRLALLYPGKHEFKAQPEEGIFHVHLKLILC